MSGHFGGGAQLDVPMWHQIVFNEVAASWRYSHFEETVDSPVLLTCQTAFTIGFVFQFFLPFGW